MSLGTIPVIWYCENRFKPTKIMSYNVIQIFLISSLSTHIKDNSSSGCKDIWQLNLKMF